MSEPVPVYEAKNRFPFYLHKAETEGPVRITRHDKTAGYIISEEDYKKYFLSTEKNTIFDEIKKLRSSFNLNDDDFDFADFLKSNKEPAVYESKSEQELLREF